MVEDDVRLAFDKCNSTSITYELEPCIYTFKDISEALFRILQLECELFNKSIEIELDDINLKTKLVVRSGIIAIRFDENSFASTILGFNPHCEYKHFNEYVSMK